MLSKQSLVFISDNTGIVWLKIFQLYGGFKRQSTGVGNYVKGSVKNLRPKKRFYKGFKKFYFTKGKISKSLVVRQSFQMVRKDGSMMKFNHNAGLIMKKKHIVYSKHIYGASCRELFKRKFYNLFSIIE